MDENEIKVEQLDDVDFEKEQNEAKKSKKSKIKKVLIIIAIIAVLAAVGIAAFLILNSIAPERVVEDFVSYFNAGEFESIVGTMDLKGFYTVSMLVSNEEDGDIDYTKFDAKYEECKDDEECKTFVETIGKIEKNTLKEYFEGYTIKITEMDEPVQIQNTKNLYKVSANIDLVTADGETTSDKCTFYVNKTDKEYKIVNGDLVGSIIYSMILLEYENINSMQSAQ